MIKSCIPFNRLRLFICVTMIGGTLLALALFPVLLEIVPVSAGMAVYIVTGLCLSLMTVWMLEQIRKQRMGRLKQRRGVRLS